MAKQSIIAVADRFRQDRGYGEKGVVIICNGEVSGWMDSLRDPEKWAPGEVAIDASGNQWIAKGWHAGMRGASRWEPGEGKEMVP